jgi:phenylacetate-coenzyme A ligase PaaK-like adenylate-forming protein
MPPPARLSGAQHRARRLNPMLLATRRALARTERASVEELRRYQERRLRALVAWASARSPFYRRRLREAGVRPKDLRRLEDLTRLPLLERHHLADHPDELLAYPRRTVWPARSSGTSGIPVTAYRTPGSSIFELAALQRQWSWFGVRPGARSAVLRGSQFHVDHPDAVTLPNPGANQLLVSSYRLTPEHLPAIARDLDRFRPEVVEGWPSSLTLLAGLLRDAGRTLPVQGVITSSEVMTPGQVALLDQVFQGPIIDHYGQTERVVMAGGCERGGYHVFPEYGICELVAVPGTPDRFEIVGTALHNWGFPLLRYRTGDQVGPASPEPCPCGRSFPRLGIVDGRVEDMVLSAAGRPVPLPASVVDDLTGLREAQLVQHRPGVFEVRVVPGAGFDPAATERRARTTLERIAGEGQTMTFTVMESIPRPPSGKLRPVLVMGAGTR